MFFRFAGRPSLRLLSAVLLLVTAVACVSADGTITAPSDPSTENFAESLGVDLSQMTERSPRLFIQDLVVGTGLEATQGSELTVRYTGWLRSGAQFDSNAASTVPFRFTLGVGQVIPGWDIGVVGMRVGGRRRLVFGSEYGYGVRGSGTIPGGASLVFDVELVTSSNPGVPAAAR